MDEFQHKIAILEAEISLKKIEIEQLKKAKFEKDFVLMEWQDLENWLKDYRPKNNYHENPRVTRGVGYLTDYCKLTDSNELQIGAYYNHDYYPRGKPVYVSRTFKPYSNH